MLGFQRFKMARFALGVTAAMTGCAPIAGGVTIEGGQATSPPGGPAPTPVPVAGAPSVPVGSPAPTSPTPPTAPGTPTNPTSGPANAPTVTGCAALGSWDAQGVQFEVDVLALVNAQRAKGASCPGGSTFGAAPPLSFDPNLTCETETYAKAMKVGNFFSHTGLDGTTPFDRMTAAGVHWTAAAENIAEGQTTPQSVMTAWMSDAGHCGDLMGQYTFTGIGFYQNVWVQDFAKE